MKKILMMALMFGSVSLFAAALDGQAGGDVVNRAQAPEEVVDVKESKVEAPAPEAGPQASSKDAIVIGVVSNITLVGDVAFCRAENVEALLSKALCDGKDKTVGELKAALASTKAALSARGFYVVDIVPSRADAYDDVTKNLELSVQPARFGEVRIKMKNNDGKGDWYCEDQIRKRFKFVKKGAAFNYLTFRQALRLLNGHPDLTADTKLRFEDVDVEATDDGILSVVAEEAEVTPEEREVEPIRTVVAEVEVDDQIPLHATVEINNHAMKELKQWQFIATLQAINLTGVDDVLSITPGLTFDGKMWSLAGSYMRPFDWLLGGSWSVYGGYSNMDCDEIVPRADLLGIGGFAGLNTSWNLYDDERRNVAFNLGIMWRMLRDQWFSQTAPLSQRNLHIAPLTAGFSYGDKCRDWLGGLDYFSISETVNLNGDRSLFYRYSENADPNYLVLRLSWSRLQPLFGPKEDGEEWRCWSAFQKLEGQTAHGNVLVSPERLAYGGFNCLRGYRNRGYLGDDGFYGTTEFRTPVWCNPLTGLIWSDLEMAIERVQFAVFTDYGWLTYNEITTGKQQKDEFLWSAGFGIRAALTRYISLNFDFAVPLRKCYAHNNDNRYEVYISVKFQY